ncbi:MAG: 16S rRNA processing protein RimM [Burkholderiales bacterium]|nr:16S rRNA processing protein RimM [Burkholderiales bacterium]
MLMAVVGEPYGLTGRVKLHVYSDDRRSLAGFRRWWMAAPGAGAGWVPVAPEECAVRGEACVAKLPGVDDRDQAFARKGWRVAVARSEFAPSGENEYYWADLIGKKVINRDGVELGSVSGLLDLGPHEVLKVAAVAGEILIPFVARYVDAVDLGGGVIRVDWGVDY